MKTLPDTQGGGYVAAPRDVEHVVEVGFFSLWLTRDTLEQNGREGKLLYVHHYHLWITRWLFDTSDSCIDRKWKSAENFKRDADSAFFHKVNQYLGETNENDTRRRSPGDPGQEVSRL